ncbi:MAG: hypothetical protein HZB38_15545 [Planctomycetes bacterium]|nr:hypothetical protein [Planctomycetota bacterium]
MSALTNSIPILCVAAAAVGAIHTLAGPDHYVPFWAMGRIGRWSLARTLRVTLLCGIGHVASSLVLAGVVVLGGLAAARMRWIDAFRGDVAAWLLIGFGLAYTLVGVRRAIRARPHTHWHRHGDGTAHDHTHTHEQEHLHVHAHNDAPSDGAAVNKRPQNPTSSMTPWILFTVFIFGPCEAMLPLILAPAAEANFAGALLVAAIFSAATISTMLACVALGYWGAERLRFAPPERYTHLIGGLTVLACGVAIRLGL